MDVARARADTPGCSQVLHFNNAGAALMPRPVLDAVVDHLHLESAIGGYEAADAAAGAIERTYATLAELLGCTTDEIAVVENATRAWDMAFYSFRFERGDRILTARAEYASNFIAYLQVARHTGASVEAVPNDFTGQVSIDALESMMDDRVKLISMTHVPTNSGLVNPAEAVGRIARTWKVPFLLDACQSVGQLVTRVDDLGCDILSGTGRKYLRGPRGTGFLYVRKSLIEKLEPPFLDLHAAEWLQPDRYMIRGDARRFENWESNVAGKIGLGVAVQYALDIGLQSIQERVAALAEHFRCELARVHSVTLPDPGQQRCGIVTFTLGDVSPEVVQQRLAAQRINVTTSSRASTILDMDERQLDKVVRASVHYYNTEE
ncbi:MAG TPA: aminotransferase class V-fold PLP-dependent enzyme, partial [Chloroflexota bacterium]